MGKPRLVIDNSALSAFGSAGWFDGLRIWNREYQVVTSRRIWAEEFTVYHDRECPEWLSIEQVDLSDVRAEVPNALSLHDWSGVIAAERVEESVLITNDLAMKKTAERRDVKTLWGTAFAIQTYQKCGISVEDFNSGTESYLNNVTLSERVADELRDTEKNP